MRVRDLDGNLGFFVPLDLTQIDGPLWLQVAEAGEWYNPRYGEVPITLDDLATMFSNFKSGLHPPAPQELPFDYEHLSFKPDRRPGDGVASGWIKDLQLRKAGTELWALVDFTEPAKEKLRKKEYKGISPVIAPNWTAHGGKEIGPTLLGGALTNYQTIPSCAISCSLDPSMATRHPKPPVHKGRTMKLKNAAGEEVEIPDAQIAALSLDALGEIVPAVKDLRAKVPGSDVKVVKIAEYDALNTQVQTLGATVETLKADNVSLKASKDAQDAILLDQIIDGLLREGRALPAEKETLQELAKANRTLFDKMVTARKAGAPLVKLDAVHGGGGNNEHAGSAVKQFDALVAEIQSKDTKLTFTEAVKKASNQNPDLARQRNVELSMPIGKGGVALAQ
jgi:phage I-like protein